MLSLGVPLVFTLGALGVGWAVSSPAWRGPETTNFRSGKFRNTVPVKREPAAIWREGWARGAWPARGAGVAAAAPPPRAVQGDTMRVTWIGHATALVQVAGMNLLTDPVWSPAAGPLGQLGPRRFVPAGLPIDALPRIDAVLVSHNHYDHLDVPTLRRLHARDAPRIYTPLGNAAFLARAGVPGAVELDWWQSAEHTRGFHIEATEVRHFSGRGLFDRDKSLWCGFTVHTPVGRVYFAGDTGYGAHFAETARRSGAPRLALLPVGAYLPRSIMQPVHMDPTEAVQAHRDLGAGASLGIHWGSFRLTAEAWDDPPRRLAAARAQAGVPDETFRVLDHGAGWDIPREPAPR